MTLALLITAVCGAWAQSSLDVVELEVPAEWATDESNMIAADLPGFNASTLAKAQAWTGAPTTGVAYLIYAFVGEEVKYVSFEKGKYSGDNSQPLPKKSFFGTSNVKFYYTTGPASAEPDIDVKWDAATKTGTFTMPAGNVELQVEYEPTKVTMAVNDKTMGTAEVGGESKVEWTADTWKGWTTSTKEYTVDDITMTSSENAYIQDYPIEGNYLHSLDFFVDKWDNSSNVTFSTTGAPFSRIEFTMLDNYEADWNPNIMPLDNWTFEGKSAKWEGEATKSLTLQSCTTSVSKITFFKGDIPDGVTVNGDGTFTVAKTATVTLKATPAEGYKFLYWEDDQTNTNPVREVTIESGMADMTYKAVFAENEYNITFAEGTNPDPENPEWTATPNPAKTKQTVTVTYSGERKVMGVKAEKKAKGNIVDLSTYSGGSYEVTEDVTFTGTTNNEISILYKGEGYEVTLDNVNAPKCFIAAQDDNYNINVKLKGTSRLMGIYTQNVNVTIGEAEAGGTVILVDESPLGGNATTITINGGTVKAKATASSTVYSMLEVNGGAVYLEAAEDSKAVSISASGSVTLYGWNGSAWETYTDHRYLSTDNSKAPSQWTW